MSKMSTTTCLRTRNKKIIMGRARVTNPAVTVE